MLDYLISSEILQNRENLGSSFATAVFTNNRAYLAEFKTKPMAEQKQLLEEAEAALKIPAPLFGLVLEDKEWFNSLFAPFNRNERMELINKVTKYANPQTGTTLLMAALKAHNLEIRDFIYQIFMGLEILKAKGKLKDFLQRNLVQHAILSNTLAHFQLIRNLIGDVEFQNQLDQKDLYKRNTLMNALYVDDISIFYEVFAILLSEDQRNQQLTERDSHDNTLLMLSALDPDLKMVSGSSQIIPRISREHHVFNLEKLEHVLNLYPHSERKNELRKRNKDGDTVLTLLAKVNNFDGLKLILKDNSFAVNELKIAYEVSKDKSESRELLQNALLLKTFLSSEKSEIDEVVRFVGKPELTFEDFIAQNIKELETHNIPNWKMFDGRCALEHAMYSNQGNRLFSMLNNGFDSLPLLMLASNPEICEEYLSKLKLDGIPFSRLVAAEKKGKFMENIQTDFSFIWKYKDTNNLHGEFYRLLEFLSEDGARLILLMNDYRNVPKPFTSMICENKIANDLFDYFLSLDTVQEEIIFNLTEFIEKLIINDMVNIALKVLSLPTIRNAAHQRNNELLHKMLLSERYRYDDSDNYYEIPEVRFQIIINELFNIDSVRNNIELHLLLQVPREYAQSILDNAKLYGFPLPLVLDQNYIQSLRDRAVLDFRYSERGLLTELLYDISDFYESYKALNGNFPFNQSTLNILRILEANRKVKEYEISENDNHETSMSDRTIAAANAGYEQAKQLYRDRFEAYGDSMISRLCSIEKNIRGAILDQIIYELDDSEKSNEIRVFIQNSRENLIVASNLNLMENARKDFFNTNSVGHTAWRAYDKNAPTVQWENMLTSDCDLESRERVAYYFLGLMDPAVMVQSFMSFEERRGVFVGVIAEIRRAHNDDENSVDNPSCKPGTIGRTSKMGAGHPLLQIVDPVDVIPEIIQRILTERLQAHLVGKTDDEIAAYALALEYLTKETYSDILEGKQKEFFDIFLNPVSVERLSELRTEILTLLPTRRNYESINHPFYGNIEISEAEKLVNDDLKARKEPRMREISIISKERDYISRQVINLTLNGVAQNIAANIRPVIDEREDMEVVDPDMPYDLNWQQDRINTMENSNIHQVLKNIRLPILRRELVTMEQKTEYFKGIFSALRHSNALEQQNVDVIAFLAKKYVDAIFSSGDELDKETPTFYVPQLQQAYEDFRETKEFQVINAFEQPEVLQQSLTALLAGQRNRNVIRM